VPLRANHEIEQFWRAVARYSFRDGSFVWGSPVAGNAISDAEQLLAILFPATWLRRFRLDVPDQTLDEVLEPLRLIGDRSTVPRRLIRAQTDYLTRYRDADRRPIFPAGTYLTPAGPPVDVVESYAIGLRLSLASIGFARVYRTSVTDSDARADADRLEDLARTRLTAAMVGLLRSFAVQTFDDDSAGDRRLRGLIAQDHRDESAVLAEFRSRLAEIRVSLYDEIRVGSQPPDEARAATGARFACGWSWGVITDTPDVEVVMPGVAQPAGTAARVPDLYFTWTALQAISELFSARTRLLALLDEDQQRLARALQLRSDLTLAYWSRLATFGDHQWPVERLPWRGTDGGESDYQSLLVTAITMTEVGARTGNTDVAFGYLLRVFARLAARHRIVRPPHADPPGTVRLSGHRIPLAHAIPGPATTYHAADFTTVLFNAVVRAAAATFNDQLRADLTDLAELVWSHLPTDNPRSDSSGLFRFGSASTTGPNWHNVLRLSDGMTVAALTAGGAGPAVRPLGFVHQLLADADAAVDALDAAADDGWATQKNGIQDRLNRARRLADRHPARAAALLYQVIGALDPLLPDDEPSP
jgi:hypothetical protein